MRFPSSWVVWILLTLAVVLTAAGVSNLNDGETRDGVICIAIGAFLLLAFVNQRREQRAAAAFRAWLAANAAAILERGGAQYGDKWVTGDTRTRTLTLCVSMVMAGFKLPSRPLIEGSDAIGARAAVYSVVTLLLGWWSIHGLFWTPAALFNNLRGGQEATMRDHIVAMGLVAPAAR